MEPEPGPTTPPSPERAGNRAVRVGLKVVLAIVVVVLLFQVVFPWFNEYQDDPTLEGAPATRVVVALF